MVKITKPYIFTGPDGPVTFKELFDGRKQLIIYHFMLGPDMAEGCTGCSFLADNMPSHLEHLNSRQTTFILVSRAPFSKIEEFKKRMGWTFPWYSSFDSDFNYDFHASLDEDMAPREYNFRSQSGPMKGEMPGLSVFLAGQEGEVFHTYSTYARGLDRLLSSNQLLDSTKLGRLDAENGDWKLHDQYGT